MVIFPNKTANSAPFHAEFTLSPSLSPIPLSPRIVASYIEAMAKTRARHGTYLFQRGSTFYVKLRSPTGRVEKSLHTSDRREAEILALPEIERHKRALLAARPRLAPAAEAYPPGLHTGLGGERIFATATELHYLDEQGRTIRTELNSVMGGIIGARQSAKNEFEMHDAAYGEAPSRPKAPTKNGDDGILETYLTHNNLSNHFRREAEATWAIYKSLIGKPLKDATRDDGRKLAKHFADAGNKSATIAKKLGWLRAACELAIGEKKLSLNPFVKVIPKTKDKLRRRAFTENEMEVCKTKQNEAGQLLFSKLSDSDQLLFRLLACTGMRLSEAFQINGEQTEDDVRFVVVGTKTDASLRRVPLPSALLPLDKIIGSLFVAEPSMELAAKAASKRLNDFIDDCGLTDPALVVHSLRHRAARRMRRAGVRKKFAGQLADGWAAKRKTHPRKKITVWRMQATRATQCRD